MIYRVELATSAKADLRTATRWIRDEVSPAAADRWLAGLLVAATSLQRQPARCPEAAESGRFPEAVRELLHGRRRKKYRILFAIRGAAVVILHVRHTAQDEVDPP